MSLEENKAIVRRHYEELWEQGNLDVADEIYSTECVGQYASYPLQTGYPESEKRTVLRDITVITHTRVEIIDQVGEGDKVVTRWRARGRHTGTTEEMPHVVPTGKEVEVTGVHIHRLRDGKIVEVWAVDDLLGLMQQLGVIPSMQPTGA
jgi:predicted ester cyclase